MFPLSRSGGISLRPQPPLTSVTVLQRLEEMLWKTGAYQIRRRTDRLDFRVASICSWDVLAQASRGEFASDEEVAEADARLGL